jgi:hypothetical protein
MRFKLPRPIREWIRNKSRPNEEWFESSDCCGADRWLGTDICSECREHAEFIEILEH